MNREVKFKKLSREITKAIRDELIGQGETKLDGFVQVQIALNDGSTLLGVDFRAEETSFDDMPPVKLLSVDNTTTIFGKGSCTVTIKSGNTVKSMELPDELCPPHAHPH